MQPAQSDDRIKRADRIRELNDAFRRTFQIGKVMITAGVDALPEALIVDAITQVRTFSDFAVDNDPYREHDFGSFTLAGHTFFWKIDYYDSRCEFGSDDPTDPAKTTRVLTLMLAEEY
jgi:hypothetical protein